MPRHRHIAASLALVTLLGALAIATAGCYTGRVGVGFAVGYPPPPLRAEIYGVAPSPGYVWVPGYWNWYGGSYVWVGGRWTLPPYHRAVWVGPRWAGHRWYRGYWRH